MLAGELARCVAAVLNVLREHGQLEGNAVVARPCCRLRWPRAWRTRGRSALLVVTCPPGTVRAVPSATCGRRRCWGASRHPPTRHQTHAWRKATRHAPTCRSPTRPSTWTSMWMMGSSSARAQPKSTRGSSSPSPMGLGSTAADLRRLVSHGEFRRWSLERDRGWIRCDGRRRVRELVTRALDPASPV